MSDGASGFRRLVRLTIRTCVRGLVIAVLAVVPGVPLFIASVVSLPLLAGTGWSVADPSCRAFGTLRPAGVPLQAVP